MRRTAVITVCLAALLTPHVASADRGSGRVLGAATLDRTGDAAGDLVSARMDQVGHTITIWLGFAAPPKASLFRAADGGRVCVWLRGAGTDRPLCASTVDGAWRIDGTGTVLRVGKRRLGLQFADNLLKLRPGVQRWHVTATAAACQAVAGAPACVDRLPDRPQNIRGRIYRAQLSGCVAAGDDQLGSGPRDRPRIALTFDDGPWSTTDEILRLLKDHSARGTFFQIGNQIAGGDAAISRRILAEGHELGNHSWDHSNLGSGGEAASTQLTDTSAAIRAATGFTPCVFRPPYGATSRDLAQRTRAQGMTSVLWDVDTDDYQRPGVDAIRGRLLDEPRNGSIVLMHDGGGDRTQTVTALAAALPTLKQRFELVTVSELLGYEQTFKLTR